jgi:hypothetical protein
VSLGVSLALVVASSAVAIVAHVRLFRGLTRGSEALEAAALELAARSEATAARLEGLDAGRLRLEESLARLQASRERAATLAWALQDVRRLLQAFRWLTPAK